MEDNALTRLDSNAHEFTLTYSLQALKHHFTRIRKVFPVRFNVDYLPKVREYDVSKVTYRDGTWRITCSSDAFFGVRGVAPRTCYSQALLHYFGQNDRALITFFNGFNNRFYHFDHLSEVKHSLALQAEEESFAWLKQEKAISHRLTRLTGELSNVKSLGHQWLQYVGLITNRSLCIHGLKSILKDYFCIDCKIINTSAFYQSIDPQNCSRIGMKNHNNQLGMTLFAGRSAALYGQYMDIHLFPQSADEMESMRMDNRLAEAILNLADRYFHAAVRVRLFISIDSSMLPCLRLTSGAISLGFSSWLCTKHLNHCGKITFPYKAGLI